MTFCINPSTYPLCNIPGHHPDSTPHIHDVAIPTAIPHAVLPGDVALVPSSLASTPDAPSPSVPTPVHVDEQPHGCTTARQYFGPCVLIPRPSDGYGKRPRFCHFTGSSCRWCSAKQPSTRTMPPTPRETSTSTSSVPPLLQFPSRTTQTSWCIPAHQRSRPQLLLNRCSMILQVRPC
jgi:hypothetical protein